VSVELAGVYAILDAAATPDPERLLAALLAGGVRLVQYRAKRGVDRKLVRALHAQTQRAGALLLVNDDLAAALDADGLHVGQEDLADLEASGIDGQRLRAALAGKVLGVSCGLPAEARDAFADGADYVGTGPFKTTRSKADAGDAIGVTGLAAVVAASPLPVAAIGGIELEDLETLVRAGATMAAVLSAFSTAPDPEARARAFVARWARAAA
jgi:thiamine-phosphate diphosphorylase